MRDQLAYKWFDWPCIGPRPPIPHDSHDSASDASRSSLKLNLCSGSYFLISQSRIAADSKTW